MKTTRPAPFHLAAISLLLAAGFARAASLNTESFDSNLSGWTNGIDATKWIATNHLARVSFTVGMFPATAALEAGPLASGDSFTGDFLAAGIEAIGFSFFTENMQPSTLKIEISGGGSSIFQDLLPRLGPTATWSRVICPLIGPDAARWVGIPTSELPSVLTNVSLVAVRILTRGQNNQQAYRLDDVFLDRLPSASGIAMTGTNSARIRWANLRTNFTYNVESVATLTDPWSSVSTFVATNNEAFADITNSLPDQPLFHRLQVP